jgi:hypothetical protein
MDKNNITEVMLYKLYDQIFLNSNFEDKLVDILEDLYDNNDFVSFNIYFFSIPPYLKEHIRFEHLGQYFSKYDGNSLNHQIIKVYKNTGLILPAGVYVFYPIYDRNNLKKIAQSFKFEIIKNIELINKDIYKEQGNTKIIIDSEVNINNEIHVLITANYNDPITKIKRLEYIE